MADGTPLTLTTSDDAWEFFYEFLGNLTERRICVRLNDDAEPVELAEVRGDLYSDWNESGDTKPVVLVKPWNPATREYDDARREVRLFNDDHTCAITRIHVL